MHPSRYIIIMSLIGVSLAACSGVKTEAKYPERRAGDRDIVYAGEREGIFGKGGLGLVGSETTGFGPRWTLTFVESLR